MDCTSLIAYAFYTEEYRAEVDPLTDFIEERTILAEDARIERSRLLESYRQWAHATGEQPLSPKAFSTALKRRVIRDGGKSGNTRYWRGIALVAHVLEARAAEPF